jgi:hypothetical protein
LKKVRGASHSGSLPQTLSTLRNWPQTLAKSGVCGRCRFCPGHPLALRGETRVCHPRPRPLRDNYISQTDDYAAARERVAFLLLLDLRKANAGGSKTAKKGGATPAPSTVALYSLRESFRVDGLSAEPQIQDAAPNAVIVGLVPGNRLRPSCKTFYSSGVSK